MPVASAHVQTKTQRKWPANQDPEARRSLANGRTVEGGGCRNTPNGTAALSSVANPEAARYFFVVVSEADVMIAGRRYETFVLAWTKPRPRSIPSLFGSPSCFLL